MSQTRSRRPGGRRYPAATEKRRDTVESLNRRISCIHRMYNSS